MSSSTGTKGGGESSGKLVKNLKSSDYSVEKGKIGEMTDVKQESPMNKNQKQQQQETISGGSPSTTNSSPPVWGTGKGEGRGFVDRGASTSLGIGDGDKAAFPPITTGNNSGSEGKQGGGEHLQGDDHGSDEDGEKLAVSVSQAGKKYIITKRNLIVNYLPQTFTDKQLFNLFVSFGAIDSVKIMRDATTGYSYGFGFVNFVHEEDGIKARSEMNGTQVENKRIKVSFARPPSDDIKDTNLYVTNLPRTMTEEDLFKLFAPFGEIVQRKLLVDRYTNLPRGVAFIRFERRDQAAAAINALNNYIPQGADEPIRIRLAEDHGKQKAAYLAGFRAGMGLPSGPPGGGKKISHAQTNNAFPPVSNPHLPYPGHTKALNPRSNSWNSYPGGKRTMDGSAWNFERRNRSPSCNPIIDGYWTADGIPVASGPYGYPGGDPQHPFYAEWGFSTPVTYTARSEEIPSYTWRSAFQFPY